MRSDWKAEELKPGAHVEWRQYTAEGFEGLRSGEVWDRGPDVEGCRAVAWVVPYASRPYDPYALVAVGIASRRQAVTDLIIDTYARRGELFTSCRPSSPLGQLGVEAAKFARKARGER